MKHLIYADNAATTKLDIDACEAMKPFLLNEYANASQPYFFAKKQGRHLKMLEKPLHIVLERNRRRFILRLAEVRAIIGQLKVLAYKVKRGV